MGSRHSNESDGKAAPSPSACRGCTPVRCREQAGDPVNLAPAPTVHPHTRICRPGSPVKAPPCTVAGRRTLELKKISAAVVITIKVTLMTGVLFSSDILI